jgi:hypothetical protein
MGDPRTTPTTQGAGGYISGSFIFVCHPNVWDTAYSDASMFWAADNWRALIRDMHAIGMDTVIWANTAFWGRPLFPGYEAKVGRRLRTGCEDPLGIVADEADRLGMKVFYGVGLMGRVSQVRDYSGMEKPWPDSWFRWNTALVGALLERYGSRPSFAGLYIAYEMDFLDHEVELYETLIRKHLRPVIGRTKMLASPGELDSPSRDMDKFLKKVERAGFDILAPQDYGGRGGIETGVQNAQANARGLERAARPLADMGVTLWSNCETFRLDGTPDGRSVCMPGPMERIRRQIEIQSPLVEKLICWIYQGVMNRRTDLVDVGHPSAQTLYAEYVAYLKQKAPGERPGSSRPGTPRG